MNSKLATVLMAYCLIHFFSGAEGSFIKPNNVPRVGRSNEEIPFDQGSMGYVIKTNKNIPRMGRRNYDSVSQFFFNFASLNLPKPRRFFFFLFYNGVGLLVMYTYVDFRVYRPHLSMYACIVA